MALTEALHEGNVLMLRKTPSSQNPKRKATEVEEAERYVDIDIPVPPAGKVGKAPEGSATSVPSETKHVLPSTSTEGKQPRAKRPVQQSLTSMFGAKSSPKATRYAAASVRKDVYNYSEQDILRSSGTERERRKWWNEKAKQLCEDPQYDMLRGEAIDQKLHEEWRIHKAGKMLEKERETRQATEELMQEYPDLKTFLESKKKMKQETLTRNVTRLDLALKTMTRSRDTMQELSIRLQNTAKRGEEFKKLKKEMEEHREAHKFHYRELNKAQDAMSKVLEITKAEL